MNRKLRIAVADDEPEMQEYYRTILPMLGHEVVAVARTGQELVDECRDQSPDLIITDIKMPDTDGIDAAARIYRHRPVPIILVSGYFQAEYTERAAANHILSYLVKPIRQDSLEAAIAVVMPRFEHLQVLQQEANELKQTLDDRKLVERAKGLLMKKASLDEEDAFRRLQALASEQNRKLVEVARMLLDADAVFQTAQPARSRAGRRP